MKKASADVAKILVGLGLTENESTVYITGLRLSPCTAQTLTKETHIKRPTVYHTLNNLIEKGLATEQRRGSKAHFVMIDPEQLIGLVDRKRVELDTNERNLNAIIPLLASLQKEVGISVVHHHGLAGAKVVMDVAYRSKTKHWDIIAPYHNFLRSEKELSEQYLRTRTARGITARTLWEMKRGERPLTSKEQETRNPRILPKALVGKFSSMIIIFDDKVAIFSSHENLSAILISSSEIQALFQAMFEGLWELSSSY